MHESYCPLKLTGLVHNSHVGFFMKLLSVVLLPWILLRHGPTSFRTWHTFLKSYCVYSVFPKSPQQIIQIQQFLMESNVLGCLCWEPPNNAEHFWSIEHSRHSMSHHLTLLQPVFWRWSRHE